MKILLVANTDWYLYNYRLALAKHLRDEGWEVLLASPDGQYVPRIQSDGFRWAPISMSRRGLLPHQELGSVVDLLGLYRREKPDLLHHFTMKPVLYGSIAARWAGCEAIVNSIAGLGYLFLSERIHIKLIRRILSPIFQYALSGDHVRVIFENEGDQSYFVKQGFIEEWKTTIVQGVGVNLDRFQASDEPDGDVSVLMASRLLWDKGVREFIEAARMIGSRNSSVRFILVGRSDPGNPSSIDESLVKEWVSEGIIEWWGHRKEMPEVYAHAHIVVLPSYGEGVPTVLLEAAASARPVVASDIPGCRAVVREGETGILVPAKDSSTLAHAIEVLIENQDLRRRMGREGRKMMEQRFNQSDMNRRIINVYDRLLMDGQE